MPAVNPKNLLGGLLMIALGQFFFVKSFSYGIGSFGHMGPGFVPMVLGAVLSLIGIGIAATAFTRRDVDGRTAFPPLSPRFVLAVTASMAAFALCIERFGLVPAVVLTSAIAACGDRDARWLGTIVLIATMTIFTWLVFREGLGLSLPAFRWRP